MREKARVPSCTLDGSTMKSLPLFASILSFGLVACDSGPDKPSTSSSGSTSGSSGDTGGTSDTGNEPPPGSWAVGEAGLMLRVGADHSLSQYPLGLDVDLRGPSRRWSRGPAAWC